MRGDIEQAVIDAIATACRADRGNLRPSSKLAELGLDSLTLVAVLAELEVRFALELDTDALLTLIDCDDVGELVARASRLLAQKPSS